MPRPRRSAAAAAAALLHVRLLGADAVRTEKMRRLLEHTNKHKLVRLCGPQRK